MVGLTAVAIDIDLPAGWSHAEQAGATLLVARPPTWPGALAPAITVSRIASPAVPALAAYREHLVGTTMLSLGGHLVHAESGHRPYDHVDLTLATEQWGIDVTLTLRHVVRVGGDVVVATGVAADQDWAEMAPSLMRVVHSVRPRRPEGTGR